MDALTRDVRIAVRRLRHNPGFTATAALTLGLGIGAVTAAASIVESLLLRPLPCPDTGRIVVLWERPVTHGVFDVLRAEARLGRRLREGDGPGRGRVILLSDGLWRGRFGGDPAIVGRTGVRPQAPASRRPPAAGLGGGPRHSGVWSGADDDVGEAVGRDAPLPDVAARAARRRNGPGARAPSGLKGSQT